MFAYVCGRIAQEKTTQKIKQEVSKYVSEKVLDKIDDDDISSTVGTKELLTVMFIDMRGFTAISEKYPVEKVIEILNKKYLLNKTEDDLNDYGYNSIAPITEKEKLEIFESDEFFKGLEFKEGFLEFFKRNKKNVNFVVATKGTPANLEKKEKWLKKNLSKKIKFIGIDNKDFSKKQVNMAGGIQIDDFITSLDTNADLKILYKDNHSFEWQTN